jgi:hypothetical protein
MRRMTWRAICGGAHLDLDALEVAGGEALPAAHRQVGNTSHSAPALT